jgi:DNA-binding IclR family transcriptional regulator
MKSDKRGKYINESVVKAGEILRFIADSREPVGPSEAAKAAGVSVNTAFRLLVTLAEIGFLTPIGDRYDLGMGLALFWARFKARREADRDRIDRELKSISIEGESHG